MNKHEAIYKLYPTVVTIHDDVAYDADGNEVTYDNDAVTAEINANAYKEQRASEYKSLTEQLDMQYWDAVNGTTNWQDHINAIKTKYPKPE